MHTNKQNLVYVPAGVPIYYKDNGLVGKSTEPTVVFVVDRNVTIEGEYPYFLLGGNESIIKVFYNGGHAFLYEKDVFPVSEDINYDVKTKRSV